MASRRPLVRASGGNRQLPSGDTLDASVTGNAATATKLATGRTISWTGDVTGSTTYDGSGNSSAAVTLAASGVTAGTYGNVTLNAKGLVTGATQNPVFLGGVSIQNGYASGTVVMGADVNATTITNNTRKLARFTCPPHLTTNPNWILFAGDTQETNNVVYFGGSPGATTGGANVLRFYTSTDQASGSHTLRWFIGTDGHIVPGSTTAYDVGSSSARSRIFYGAGVNLTGPSVLGTYTLSTLPSAAANNGATIVVSNATRGWAWCRSNGTSWIDLYTQAAVA